MSHRFIFKKLQPNPLLRRTKQSSITIKFNEKIQENKSMISVSDPQPTPTQADIEVRTHQIMSGLIARTAQLTNVESLVYKTIGPTPLLLHILKPVRPIATPTPALVFFFGGGWDFGSIEQFLAHALYFRERGFVTILVDYRVKSRHDTGPMESILDAKSSIRWIRAHAETYGIDPHKIIAVGGSSGAHLAVSSILLSHLDEAAEDHHISAKPDTAILLNPPLDLISLAQDHDALAQKFNLQDNDIVRISPIHNVHSVTIPVFILHGTADQQVPFEHSHLFCKKMQEYGNDCQLISLEGYDHGFFNYTLDSLSQFSMSLQKIEDILAAMDYLPS